jgi:hypothetical protein
MKLTELEFFLEDFLFYGQKKRLALKTLRAVIKVVHCVYEK